LAAAFIIAALFFIAGIGIMVRMEMKTVERLDKNSSAASKKKRGTRTLNGPYLIR
jgi:hypothetical protein